MIPRYLVLQDGAGIVDCDFLTGLATIMTAEAAAKRLGEVKAEALDAARTGKVLQHRRCVADIRHLNRALYVIGSSEASAA